MRFRNILGYALIFNGGGMSYHYGGIEGFIAAILVLLGVYVLTFCFDIK